MSLTIVKADEPIRIKNLVLCLYACPGLGKTTTGYTANKALLLDFDKGSYRAKGRKDTVIIENWTDVSSITSDDLDGYDTVVMDTAGRALDALERHIIQTNPKMGNINGGLTLQGYGKLKKEFIAWVSGIRSFSKDLVLIAHSTEDRSGDELIERIDMTGSSKNEVYKIADAMGRLHMVPNKRYPALTFSPTDTAFGKDPAQLGTVQLKDADQNPYMLGDIIEQIKDAINEMSEEQLARQKLLDDWNGRIMDLKTSNEVNSMIDEANASQRHIKNAVKGMLAQHAKSLDLKFNKDEGKYFTLDEEEASD